MNDTDRPHCNDKNPLPLKTDMTRDDTSGTSSPEDSENNRDVDFQLGISIDEMTPGDTAAGTVENGMEENIPAGSGPAPESGESGMGDAEDIEDQKPASNEYPESKDLLSELAGIRSMIKELTHLFETKISVDTHKNKVIDNLHDELQAFREGIVKKQLYSFVTDLIKVIDDIRKFKRHYDDKPPTAENMESLLDFLEGIASDIEDLFSWQGVIPFRCKGSSLDTGRQRVIKKIECDDPDRDRMVAESLRPGYEWDGKVIRPEMVSIYICSNNKKEDASADGQTY